MDIRKIMTICAGCVPTANMCIPMESSSCQPFFTNCAENLVEDGGICLADKSPNGELLSSLWDSNNFPKPNVGQLLSSSSTSSSLSSFQTSNEALAEKISTFSAEASCTPDSSSYLIDDDKLSFTSLISNEAEAVTISSNSFEWCHLNKHTDSLWSFTESNCGGEDLATTSESSSSESSDYVDSLEVPNASSSSSITNKDSLSLSLNK